MMRLPRMFAAAALAALLGWGMTSPVLHAQDAAAPAAAAAAAKAPEATLEQRVNALEAYFQNTDPNAAFKDLKVKKKNDKGEEEEAYPEGFKASTINVPGAGHNGWMMTSSALVLFMTLPGLALFYGGLVRKKNVLSVLAQCLGCAGMIAILWWAFGYSLVFGKNFNSPYLGGSEFFFMKGVDSAPNTDYTFWVSQNVFSMYQLMFAIITPALIVGAIAERMKFSAIMAFIAVWMFVVYFPMAHMVWGVTGLMNGVWNKDAAIPAIDFAGGTVVHMTSGWSALILCMILGKRLGFGKEKMAPHSMVLCMVGTGMLWVGWYGFNAGSALAADGIAANAFTTTTLAAATASFVWALMERVLRGHASILGFCSGAVAGLVVITPACGFVGTSGAMLIGVLAAVVPYIFVMHLKAVFGYDDALDTFGVHAVGGTLGALLTGFLADKAVNANLDTAVTASKTAKEPGNGLVDLVTNGGLVGTQLKAVILTLIISIVATVVIAFIVKAVIGLRPSSEVEDAGLDISEHGEEGYIL
ncbi:MAG: Ammonia channel precursor [Verrucomicrobiota bacterium]